MHTRRLRFENPNITRLLIAIAGLPMLFTVTGEML